MTSLPRLLGSFTSWAVVRLGELVFVIGLVCSLVAHRQKLSVLLLASAVGLLVLVPVYFHPFAFGYADEQGIVVCRYFKLHFVPWSEVAGVELHMGFGLLVRLGRRVSLTKTVKFEISFRGEEVNAIRDGCTPQIVTWLTDRLSSAQAPQRCSASQDNQDA